MTRFLGALTGLVLAAAAVHGEDLPLPHNVRAPARSAAPASDASLPYLYLEPHDFCYDGAGPLKVTLHAVNQSGAALAVEWRAIVAALALEPVGPGRVRPTGRASVADATVGPGARASITIDLKDLFKVTGAAVYRLTYARPLADGRIHIAPAARFVIEDDAAVDRLAATLDDAAVRATFAALLKDNYLFAAGGPPPAYGDELDGRRSTAAAPGHWDTALAAARKSWHDQVVRLAGKGGPAGRPSALDVLLDRLLTLSDGFRVEPDQAFFLRLDSGGVNEMKPPERERMYLKLIRSQSPAIVSRSMNRLMSMRSQEALDEMFRIADGADRKLALEALGSLSSYRASARITQFLRRKMAGDDRELALEAAIITCYAGDWSGLPLLLGCLRSDNAQLRLKAIAQMVDDQFRPHRARIVPALLDELKHPLSDEHLERAIESLATYPSAEVLEAVKPFLKHPNAQVSGRARLTVASLQRQ